MLAGSLKESRVLWGPRKVGLASASSDGMAWGPQRPAIQRDSEEPSSAEVFFWDALSGKCLESLRQNRRRKPRTHTSISLSSAHLPSESSYIPYIPYILSLSLCLSRRGHQESVLSVAFSASGKLLGTTSPGPRSRRRPADSRLAGEDEDVESTDEDFRLFADTFCFFC